MRPEPNAACAPARDVGPMLTRVELTWVEGGIERWIRFGHETGETIIDRRRRVLRFAPNSVFAFVRWASNDFGTLISRIDIVRAVDHGASCQTLPFVRPGGARLAEGRACAPGDRRRREDWRRSCRHGAGSLALPPQPACRRRVDAALQPRAASRLAPAAETRAMTGSGWTIATCFGRPLRGCRRSFIRCPS